MTDTLGGNSQAQLKAYIDRIEHLNAQMKALKEDRDVVYAQAKSTGFVPKYIRRVVKKRTMKPHDRQEDEALEATYMHGAGMAAEPPLFRSLGALAKDATSSEKLIELFKKIVPPNGDLIATIGGKPMRFYRTQDGTAHVEPYTPPGSAPTPPGEAGSAPAPRPKPEVPDCDDEGAKMLGRRYAKENRPVTDNPFPFGDKRRALFDEAWRDETGNDGMGG